MQPQFADETPLDPFNLWKGADFKVKIRKVEGYWNYDKSEFAAPGTLGNFDDDRLEKIWEQCYSLAEFEAPKNFKSYEDLKKRLDMVLGKTAPARRVDEQDEAVFDTPVGGGFNDSDITPSNKGWGQEVSDFREKAVASTPLQDEDDTLSYFAKLAEEG